MNYRDAAPYALKPEDVIRISEHYRPISDITAASDIAKVFRDNGSVYIPMGEPYFLNFLQMIGAIWTGGYISGVRAARRNLAPLPSKQESDAG